MPHNGERVSPKPLNARTVPERLHRQQARTVIRARARAQHFHVQRTHPKTTCTEAAWTPVNDPVVQARHGMTSAMHTPATQLKALTHAAPLAATYIHESCCHCMSAAGSEWIRRTEPLNAHVFPGGMAGTRPVWRQAQHQGVAPCHTVYTYVYMARRALSTAAAAAPWQQPAVTSRAAASGAATSGFADRTAAGQRVRRAAWSSFLGQLLAAAPSGLLGPHDLRRQCISMCV